MNEIKMFTWTERRVIDQNWQAQETSEQVKNPGIKNALTQQISSNIKVIKARLEEVVDAGK